MNSFPEVSFSHSRVITCEEAATARGVSIEQELKSILLKSNSDIFAVHLCGGHRIDSKAIKTKLRKKHLRFLNKSELNGFGLKPGLVNPWNIEFCKINLVCNRVFNNEFMTTNNGTFNKGVTLKPSQLLNLKEVMVGVFSCQ